MELPQTLEVISKSYFFEGIPLAAQQELARGTRLRVFEKDETIFFEKEACPGLHILQHGTVKLYKQSLHGRELIIKVLDAGASFNEVPVFDGGPNPVNAAALERCEVWIVDAQVIRRVLMDHPEVALGMIGKLAKNLRSMVQMIEELTFYQVTHRLARLIAQSPEEMLGRPDGQRLTQDALAARLGTVREVVARSLRELERSGAIKIERRRIQIGDRQRLDEWTLGSG